jgi:hypothetical protein
MTESASTSVPDTPAHARMAGGAMGRTLLILTAVISFAMFHWAGRAFNIPTYASYAGSLVQDQTPVKAMSVTAVMLLITIVLGTLIASRVHVEAGMFAGAVGLIALSCRAGPVEYVLMAATSSAVYLAMAVETLILMGFLIIGWLVIKRLVATGFLTIEILPIDGEEESLNQRLLACGGQVVAMIPAMVLLSQNDDKFQAIAAVGLSAWLGTVGSYLLFPTRPGLWYWIGPCIIGVIGYLLAGYGSGNEWQIGIASHSLARPLPLDYAGAGTAGSLIGYWMSRRWQFAREATELEEKAS